MTYSNALALTANVDSPLIRAYVDFVKIKLTRLKLELHHNQPENSLIVEIGIIDNAILSLLLFPMCQCLIEHSVLFGPAAVDLAMRLSRESSDVTDKPTGFSTLNVAMTAAGLLGTYRLVKENAPRRLSAKMLADVRTCLMSSPFKLDPFVQALLF